MADDDPEENEDNGTTVTYNNDGTVSIELANGDTVDWGPNGDVKVYSDPDGGFKIVTIDPDGTVEVIDYGYHGYRNEDPFGGRPDSGPPGTGNTGMPAVDGDGNMSDTGLRPKFWGGGDVKDPWDISDTGRVFKILGPDDGPPDDPWDRADDIRRLKLPGGGIVAVEPWDKVGPKFRPIFQLIRDGNRVTGYGFNTRAMTRFIVTLVTLTSGMQANGGG